MCGLLGMYRGVLWGVFVFEVLVLCLCVRVCGVFVSMCLWVVFGGLLCDDVGCVCLCCLCVCVRACALRNDCVYVCVCESFVIYCVVLCF